MRGLLVGSWLCLSPALGLAGCAEGDYGSILETAPLRGTNEVPANGSGATGAAAFVVDGKTVDYSVEARGLTGALFACLHSGAAGTNGPVRVTLFLAPPTGAVDGVLAQGTFTPFDVVGIGFEELLAEMRAGRAYVNVYTAAFPRGELRGQVRGVQ